MEETSRWHGVKGGKVGGEDEKPEMKRTRSTTAGKEGDVSKDKGGSKKDGNKKDGTEKKDDSKKDGSKKKGGSKKTGEQAGIKERGRKAANK